MLRIMKNWRPWEYLQTQDYEDKEMMQNFMNFTSGNYMMSQYERYDNMKHTPEERRPSAGVRPEDH